MPARLKLLAEEIAPVLTSLFRQSLSTGVLAGDCTKAFITPVFKKGDRISPANYRPVSLTCIASKLLEHILCTHISGHLGRHQIMSPLNHRSRSSVTTSLKRKAEIEGKMSAIKIGIIGGTGMDEVDLFKVKEEKKVSTPFGDPSGSLIIGSLNGVDCVLLSRHGSGHRLQPSDVNYRANVWAMRQEGCTHLVVTTACGSLQEQFAPGDIVVLDDFIDRTTKRHLTFYDGTSPDHVGVSHVPMNEPFCPHLRTVVSDSIKELGFSYHKAGTIITIEGPRFSTRAESKLFRQWNVDVINMSTVPEVILAKEAGLLYCSMALVTDYDCWREDTAAVDVDMALRSMRALREKVIKVLPVLVEKIAKEDWSSEIQKAKEIAKSSVMA